MKKAVISKREKPEDNTFSSKMTPKEYFLQGDTFPPTNYSQALANPKPSVELSNRFTTLGRGKLVDLNNLSSNLVFPKPAIATASSSFLTPNTKVATFSKLPDFLKKQEYHIKKESYEFIYFAEKGLFDTKNKSKAAIDAVVEKLFFPGFNYSTVTSQKTREFYEY